LAGLVLSGVLACEEGVPYDVERDAGIEEGPPYDLQRDATVAVEPSAICGPAENELDEIIIQLVKEDPLNETDRERELEAKYGVNILGDFTADEFDDLSNALRYIPIGRLEGVNVSNEWVSPRGGLYNYLNACGPTVFVPTKDVMLHELMHAAHMRHSLVDDFEKEWDGRELTVDLGNGPEQITHGELREKARRRSSYGIFGLVMPYSSDNIQEDVATHADIFEEDHLEQTAFWDPRFFLEHYFSGIDLLEKYEIVTSAGASEMKEILIENFNLHAEVREDPSYFNYVLCEMQAASPQDLEIEDEELTGWRKRTYQISERSLLEVYVILNDDHIKIKSIYTTTIVNDTPVKVATYTHEINFVDNWETRSDNTTLFPPSTDGDCGEEEWGQALREMIESEEWQQDISSMYIEN